MISDIRLIFIFYTVTLNSMTTDTDDDDEEEDDDDDDDDDDLVGDNRYGNMTTDRDGGGGGGDDDNDDYDDDDDDDLVGDKPSEKTDRRPDWLRTLENKAESGLTDMYQSIAGTCSLIL